MGQWTTKVVTTADSCFVYFSEDISGRLRKRLNLNCSVELVFYVVSQQLKSAIGDWSQNTPPFLSS
jgi:hypothetical protein